MRIAYDATPLLGARTGVGAFAAHLLEALALRPGCELRSFVLSWRGRREIRALLPSRVQPPGRLRPMAARPLREVWKRFDAPIVETWTGVVDVVHGTNFILPPSRAAGIVTIHDLTPVRFPELCAADTLEYPRLIRRALQRGAMVHTPSAFVRDEVIETFGAPADRVRAIHHGAPMPMTMTSRPAATSNGSAPYVLALGTVEPRKNLPLLVRAFDMIADQDSELRLVLAGPDGWGAEPLSTAIAHARHGDRIVRMGYVSNEQRASLLAGASVFAYPSVYEGFGFPPLEAMAMGVPVVATSVGALPEVLGDAALLVQPELEALADGLLRALGDSELRGALVRRGRSCVAGYSWDRCAEEMVELYRAAGSGL